MSLKPVLGLLEILVGLWDVLGDLVGPLVVSGVPWEGFEHLQGVMRMSKAAEDLPAQRCSHD